MMTVGACIAAIILLRLNIIMFIAVAVLGVIIVLIRKKQFKTIINVALFALIGFLIFIAPFVVYLVITGSLSACLDTAYFGVVNTFSDISKMLLITNVSAMAFKFIGTGGFFSIVLFIAIFPFYLYKTKGQESDFKTLLLICYFGLFATLIGNSVSGAKHMHYFMCFIPALILPTVWILRAVYSLVCTKEVKTFTATAAVAAFAFVISINSVSVLRNNILNNLRDGTDSYLSAPCFNVSDYVKMHSSPEDTVQLIGGGDAVTSYYRAKRMAASNYFYYANGRFSDDAKKICANEIFRDIKENRPKIIIFTSDWKMQDFIQHLGNPEGYQEFLKENYIIDENDSLYITYLRIEK
ncbi:MAG: hypothetical protein K5768_09765, partial [Firmicutes bacterium]|nr:hypothetical protein [Bacillota bacterium]